MMSMKAKLIGFSHSLDHWIKALVTLGEEILKLNRFKVSHGSSSPDNEPDTLEPRGPTRS